MKQFILVLSLIMMMSFTSSCGKKRVSLNPNVAKDITVLSLDGNLPDQTDDQIDELDRVITWMNRDIIKNLKRTGFNAVLVKEMKDYKPNMGKLLIIDVEKFNAGNRAARAFVGFGAGASSLDLSYKLMDEKGVQLTDWKDGVGSSKGGTYCAQTLNHNAIERVTILLNK